MKNSVLTLAALTALLAPLAQAQQTGKAALSVVARQRGQAGASAVSIEGRNGQDQPATWRVVTKDPEFAGRYRAYLVSGNRIVSEEAVSAEESARYSGTSLQTKRVKIDSTGAFMAADQAAKKALVGFDSLDYSLRNKELSSDPVWQITLVDQATRPVGELIVSAESGAVLRRTWYESGRQVATGNTRQPARATVSGPVSTAPPAGTGTAAGSTVADRAQQVWEKTRDGFEQGKSIVRTGFTKATTTVSGWIDRARGTSSRDGEWKEGTYDTNRR